MSLGEKPIIDVGLVDSGFEIVDRTFSENNIKI